MAKLVTFGRVAEERVYKGTIDIDKHGNKKVTSIEDHVDYFKIGSGTVTILKTARTVAPELDLEIIAELVAGDNDRTARALFNEFGIHCNQALTNPDPETPTSWGQWIIDGIKKLPGINNFPPPTDHYIEQLKNIPLLGTDDALVVCSEYTADNWEKFKDFVHANKKMACASG